MMARVGEEQDDRCDRAISLFERDPTLKRLKVTDVRFGFDASRPASAIDRGIPGSEIDRSWVR